MLIWSSFSKAYGNTCEYCSTASGTKVRVFASQMEFEESEFYDGEDQLKNDPFDATTAVWPGKHNGNRKQNDWWLCIPAHPNCGCGWREITGIDDKDDWFSDLSRDELKQYVSVNY